MYVGGTYLFLFKESFDCCRAESRQVSNLMSARNFNLMEETLHI